MFYCNRYILNEGFETRLLFPVSRDLAAAQLSSAVESAKDTCASLSLGYQLRSEGIVKLPAFHASEVLAFVDLWHHSRENLEVVERKNGRK